MAALTALMDRGSQETQSAGGEAASFEMIGAYIAAAAAAAAAAVVVAAAAADTADTAADTAEIEEWRKMLERF